MRRLARNGLWAHKRRLAGTFAAVFLGVAFLSGTLLLGDTLQRNFERLFADVTSGTDAVVRSSSSIGGAGINDGRAPINASLLRRVQAVPGVARAAASIEGRGALIGADGKRIGGNGPPTLAGSWIADPALNPYRIAEGRPPRADDEVVVNRGAAKAGKLKLGETTTVQTPEPVPVRIVGIATFGGADGLGPTTFTAFTPAGAQRHVLKRPGMISSIAVKAQPGISQEQLVARLRPLLPGGVEAIAGTRLTTERIDSLDREFLGNLRRILVIFAGIALFVGAFSIRNTFAIVAAQRTREAALLRAVGATRGQVLGAALLETLLVGVAASVAGLAGGIGLASGLKAMFDAFGFALPTGGLAIVLSSAVIAVVVGVIVTLLAGLGPARAASRVAPLAALRDAALDETPRRTRPTVLDRALGRTAARTGPRLPSRALGRVITLLGMPLPRLFGSAGRLAQRNAARSPRRTLGAASALIAGVAVVTAFTVVGASLKSSLDNSAATGFRGDLAIDGGSGFGDATLPPQLAQQVAQLPQVRDAVGLGAGDARVAGKTERVRIADLAELSQIVRLGTVEGTLGGATSGRDGIAISRNAAEDHGWRIGSRVPLQFPDGTREQLGVGAIYAEEGIVGDILLPRAAWQGRASQDADQQAFVTFAPGVSFDDGRAAVAQVARRWGGPELQSRSEFVAAAGGNVDMVLGIVYVLLALAVLIALVGIANTLSLATHERTRELGLLRAVGQTRHQLRTMVRGEALVIALLGTLGGLAIGVPLGWLLVRASGGLGIDRFSLPLGRLLVVLLVGGLAGVLASVRPARRAARLNVLRAVATE
jgi:putative ABC transport system permease protein